VGREILTFGYEGLSVASFVERLRSAKVEIVIDVRANPLSRKPGLSKNALAGHLNAAGIRYFHAAKMGCPKQVRDRYKVDGDWARYMIGFLNYIADQGTSVAHVAAIAKESRSCLICFEANFNLCHRTFVARAAASIIDARVIHLTAKMSVVDQDGRSAA
jgi:uncharacterized protein (DUF488 family)